jgi:hypothetical protein
MEAKELQFFPQTPATCICRNRKALVIIHTQEFLKMRFFYNISLQCGPQSFKISILRLNILYFYIFAMYRYIDMLLTPLYFGRIYRCFVRQTKN